MEVINPANGLQIATLDHDNSASVALKLEDAKEAQRQWKNRPLDQRLAIVTSFGELLSQRIDSLAKVLSEETGKPLWQSINEIRGAIERIEILSAGAECLHKKRVHQDSGTIEEIVFEPLGVVANISAWNYPYLVGVNVFVPAIIAGNVVMYKPSELASLSGVEITRLWHEAGLPDKVFQLIIGDGRVGQLILDGDLDACFFTGSHKTGAKIYQTMAQKMLPCNLELGGKDPLYAMAQNSDLKKVAQAAFDGAFYNNGQSCCAVERIYVHAQIYDDFMAEFLAELAAKSKTSTTEQAYFGSLTRKEQVALLQDQVDDALGKGARLLAGGKGDTSNGYYFQPTVLVDVDHSMKVMKEESFGPIIGIMKVASDREALELMQDTAYGLTAAFYCDEFKDAQELMSQVNTGSVYWNCCDRVSARLPWSGRKNSGFGFTLSEQGYMAFVKPKAYHLRAN